MDRKDFLHHHLDDENANLQKQEADVKAEQQQQLVKVQAIIKEVVPVLDEYRAALEQKNISTKFTHSDTGFTFLMYYADGGHNGFSIRQDPQFTDSFQLIGLFTDDDGKNYSTWNGSCMLGDTWSLKEFDEFVQKCIDEYFLYSDQHGGIKRIR